MSQQLFRTCPESGLQFHRSAEWLMRANAVAAVVMLLIGGITALAVVLTRWPAVHLLPADRFYQILTLHGINMLIFWILNLEIAILYFVGTTLLNTRIASVGAAWAAFGLMLVGSLLVDVMVLAGTSDVLMTSYVPLRAHPLFYVGPRRTRGTGNRATPPAWKDWARRSPGPTARRSRTARTSCSSVCPNCW